MVFANLLIHNRNDRTSCVSLMVFRFQLLGQHFEKTPDQGFGNYILMSIAFIGVPI